MTLIPAHPDHFSFSSFFVVDFTTLAVVRIYFTFNDFNWNLTPTGAKWGWANGRALTPARKQPISEATPSKSPPGKHRPTVLPGPRWRLSFSGQNLVNNWSRVGKELVKSWSKINQNGLNLVKKWSKVGRELIKNSQNWSKVVDKIVDKKWPRPWSCFATALHLDISFWWLQFRILPLPCLHVVTFPIPVTSDSIKLRGAPFWSSGPVNIDISSVSLQI